MYTIALPFYTRLAKAMAVLSSVLLLANASYAKPANEIAYTDVGQGKPLVLIHAYPTDQRLWQPQRAALQPYLRVITLDLWGFGKSAGKATITMNDYADEVKQLLDTLHIQKAVVGGESMGGYVALAFLKRYPDRVSGLVLSDTQAIADSREQQSKRELTAANMLKNGTATFIHDFMPIALSPDAPQQTRAFLLSIVNGQTAEGMAAALRGIAYREDTSLALKKTALPVLIMTGEKDKLISPQQSSDMHALAKNSRLITIPGAGHLSSLEKPDEWNQAVLDWMNTVG